MKKTEKDQQTIKNLKAMIENGKTSRMRAAGRVTKYGTIGFARNIWLSIASALVMVITLTVIFATVIANLVLISVTETMKDKIDITVYMKPETTAVDLSRMSNILYKDSNIKSVQAANSERELERFMAERKDNPDILKALEDPEMKELLLKSMNATITIKIKNIDDISSVRRIIEDDPVFKENVDAKKPASYDTKRVIIERIRNWANIARVGGLTLGAIFLALSILMVFNTIRIATFSRREEIYMMKLIGANNSFIKGPFLVEAEISGLISGVIATVIGISGLQFVLPKIGSAGINVDILQQILMPEWMIIVIITTVVSGAIISSISARLAMVKYIK